MSRAPSIPHPIFPFPGAAAEGEHAVPVFEGFRTAAQGIPSFELREGDNPQ